MILQPFSISKNSGIVLTYQSGASAVGELYLMRKISGRTYAELAQVVYEQIQSGNTVKLEFQWLQSTDFPESDGFHHQAVLPPRCHQHPHILHICLKIQAHHR